jgi:hypothetical protein
MAQMPVTELFRCSAGAARQLEAPVAVLGSARTQRHYVNLIIELSQLQLRRLQKLHNHSAKMGAGHPV